MATLGPVILHLEPGSPPANTGRSCVVPGSLFLHIGAALFFMLAHGIHVVIVWKWRGAEDPEYGLDSLQRPAHDRCHAARCWR